MIPAAAPVPSASAMLDSCSPPYSPYVGDSCVAGDLGFDVPRFCPLKCGLSCSVLSRPILALQSRCLGCEYIGDAERRAIRRNMEVSP